MRPELFGPGFAGPEGDEQEGGQEEEEEQSTAADKVPAHCK
jgi:hypothetical protein